MSQFHSGICRIQRQKVCPGTDLLYQLLQEGLLGLGADIICPSRAEPVPGDSRHTCIEILPVSVPGQETFFCYPQGVLLIRAQGIRLLHPDPQHFLQRAGVGPVDTTVILICQAGHHSGHQNAAFFHEYLDPICHIPLHHIEQGRHDHLISCKVGIIGQDVHPDVLSEQSLIVQRHCL